MMSTVVEVVDEGLGEDFEDTPWVPPTVKRVSHMLCKLPLDSASMDVIKETKD